MSAEFEKFLDQFTASFDPASFDKDQFKAAAKAAHDAEQGEAVAIREAKIGQLSQTAEAAAAELVEQKARNYDLLMQTGPKVTSSPVNNFPEPQGQNPDDVDMSALFGTLK